jgi:hypothetical protein
MHNAKRHAYCPQTSVVKPCSVRVLQFHSLEDRSRKRLYVRDEREEPIRVEVIAALGSRVEVEATQWLPGSVWTSVSVMIVYLTSPGSGRVSRRSEGNTPRMWARRGRS